MCSHAIKDATACGKPVLMDGLCVRHVKQSCGICLESVSSTNTINSKRLTCGHAFHVPCIMEWFVEADECPTCRTKQIGDPLIRYRDKTQNIVRARFRDAIKSLQEENEQLKDTLRLQSMFVNARLERDEPIPPAQPPAAFQNMVQRAVQSQDVRSVFTFQIPPREEINWVGLLNGEETIEGMTDDERQAFNALRSIITGAESESVTSSPRRGTA